MLKPKLILLIFIFMSLCGCGFIVAFPDECKYETPNINIHNTFWTSRSLENTRHSTKAEFLKNWGKPDRIEKISDNSEIWTYNKNLWCGVIPVFFLPAPFVLPVCKGYDLIEFDGDNSKFLYTRRTIWGGLVIPIHGGGDPVCKHPVPGIHHMEPPRN